MDMPPRTTMPGKEMGVTRTKDTRDVKGGAIKLMGVRQIRKTKSMELKKGAKSWMGE
jgi:hypothetical protein